MRSFFNLSDFLSQLSGLLDFQVGASRSVMVKAAGYTLYGCVAFALFLGVHVFEDKMETLFCDALSGSSAVRVEPEGVTLSLIPPKLQMDALSISDPKTRGLLYELQRITVTPELLSLFSGRVRLNATSASYGGGIDATVTSGNLFDFNSVDVTLDVVKQSLDRVPFLIALDGRVKGTGNVHLAFTGPVQDILRSRGTVKIDGKNLRISNPVPLVKVSTFEKMTLAGALQFDGTKLDISRLSLTGDKLASHVKGTAKVNIKNLLRSKVALSSSLFIPPEKLVTTFIDNKSLKKLKAGKEVAVQISGEVSRPKISVN